MRVLVVLVGVLGSVLVAPAMSAVIPPKADGAATAYATGARDGKYRVTFRTGGRLAYADTTAVVDRRGRRIRSVKLSQEIGFGGVCPSIALGGMTLGSNVSISPSGAFRFDGGGKRGPAGLEWTVTGRFGRFGYATGKLVFRIFFEDQLAARCSIDLGFRPMS